LLAVAASVAIASPALATTSNWNADASDVWSNSARWSAGIPTAAGDTANLNFNITGTRTITIDGAVASRTVGFLTIGDTNSSNSYTLAASGGGTLTFDTGVLATNATLTQGSQTNGDTISAPLILNSSLDVSNASTVTLNLTGAISATGATRTITVGNTTTGGISITGAVGDGSGVIAFAKNNASNALTLTGANTFTGGVTLNAGTLNINSNTAVGAAASTLTITGGTVGSTVAGITLANNNQEAWNGDFTLGGTQALNFGTGAITMNANRKVTISGGVTYTIGGVIGDGGGAFSLTTANGATNLITGTLVLGGTSTYSGGTVINGGLVRFAAGIPATGSITIGTGGALSVSGPHTDLAGWLADSHLATSSTGALALTASTSEDYNPGASGFNTLALGASLGTSVAYTGNYTPANNVYFVGGGGGTISFSNLNAFTGARTLTALNSGGGTAVLANNNDYTGATTVSAGTLQVGTGSTTGSLGTTPSIAISTGATLAINHSDAFSLSIPISGAGAVANTGAGTLTLGGTNTYTGGTFINNGTIQLTADNQLPNAALNIGSGATAGSLNMGTFNQTVGVLSFLSTNTAVTNTVTIGVGKTLTASGFIMNPANSTAITTRATFNGGGALNINNTAATVSIGVTGVTTANTFALDVTALSSFTANVTTFNIGFDDLNGGTVLFSDTGNDITATTMQIAHSNGANGATSTVTLGAGTNLLKITTLNLAMSKASGTLKFASQAAGSAGTVNITGKTGGATTANITVASKLTTSTGTSITGLLDLRGHQSTVQAGTVVIGNDGSANSTGNSNATGTINFDTGTFSVATLQLANKSGTSTGTTTGNFNLSGGAANVTTQLRLGSQATAGTAVANLNITGGTLTTSVDITDGGGTTTSTLTLDGGTLNMSSHNIGSSTVLIDNLNFRSGTLQNVAQINNGAGLTKTAGTTSNTLILSGTNTYTGATTINAGTVLANTPSPNSSTGTGTVTVNNTGILGGTGNIGGAVTVNSGGTVSPGASIGTLSFASPLTLAATGVNGASTMVTELKSDGSNDVLALTGANGAGLLTIGAGDTLNLMPLDNISTQTPYTIATFSSLSGTFANVFVNGQATQSADPNLPNYVLVTYAAGDGTTAGSGNIQISVNNLTGVPEPAFMGLAGMACVGLLARRRRRRA
jgi:autotransporter-associated beta strand protein